MRVSDVASTGVEEGLILIVEDDEDVSEALVDQGYQTVCASNGAEALSLLRRGVVPRLILLDMMMPIMDGLEFRNQQRSDPWLRDIPVVVLTANVSAGGVVAGMDAERFLRKPVRLDDLLEAIAEACSRAGSPSPAM